MRRPIYFDYAATTPVDKGVAAEMAKFLDADGCFGNPASSLHAFGQEAESAIDQARNSIASLIDCQASELVFTSGATESNNLAIKGLANASDEPIHVVTTATEHKSTLAAAESLESQGHEVAYLVPDSSGAIDASQVLAALQPNTKLVSILHVNNETGVRQDIGALGQAIAGKDILFHVDAVQSVGKLPIDLRALPIDLMSISAHKFYGPKGIGALFVRRAALKRLRPIIDGGGQEQGLRSGTLPTHQIVGFGKAADVAKAGLDQEQARIADLSLRFLTAVEPAGDVQSNGDRRTAIPNIVNISFSGVDAEALLVALRNEFALSSSSACTTGTIEASHVLRAMGFEGDRLYGGIRVSFGRSTCQAEVDALAERLVAEVTRIRALELELAS